MFNLDLDLPFVKLYTKFGTDWLYNTLQQEEKKIMEDLGMINRSSEVIASSPVLEHLFLGKLRRPSNQRGFYEQGGLKEILDTLYLDEFFNDPVNCRRTIFFCKSEDDIVQIYEYVEQKIVQNFPTMKKRPWVQYHSSTGEKTLKMDSPQNERL